MVTVAGPCYGWDVEEAEKSGGTDLEPWKDKVEMPQHPRDQCLSSFLHPWLVPYLPCPSHLPCSFLALETQFQSHLELKVKALHRDFPV